MRKKWHAYSALPPITKSVKGLSTDCVCLILTSHLFCFICCCIIRRLLSWRQTWIYNTKQLKQQERSLITTLPMLAWEQSRSSWVERDLRTRGSEDFSSVVGQVSRERRSREMSEIWSLLLGQYYANLNDISQFLARLSCHFPAVTSLSP